MTETRPAAESFVTAASSIPFWRIEIGQKAIDAVVATLTDRQISMGPATLELEREIARALDVPYVLCTTSGSMALLMGCIVAGIGPGDEVIVPTRTFIATAHAPHMLGARVVLTDCLSDTTTIDAADVARKINSRTKAIIPVHLNGRAVDMEAIKDLARRHNLAVIEDACQGLFASHPTLGPLGTIGDCGCFSFSMVKLVATGQGGAIVTRDKSVYDRLYALRNHGVADVVSHRYVSPGGNFKFNDLAASVGIWQMRERERKVQHVNAIYRRYVEGLEDLNFVNVLPVDLADGGVALWTEVLCDERERLMDWLAAHGVQTRKFVPCCHTAPHFSGGRFPNSERFSRTGFNLPCGPDMPLEMVDVTIALLRRYQSES